MANEYIIFDMDDIKDKVKCFKCLANENRLAIVIFLKNKKSASVSEISDNVKTSFKATSKHLIYLIKKGILVRHNNSPFVMYSLSTTSSRFIRNIIPSL